MNSTEVLELCWWAFYAGFFLTFGAMFSVALVNFFVRVIRGK